MNILILSSKKNWGGVVTWKVNIAKKMKERCHNQYLFSSKKSALSREIDKDFPLYRITCGMDYNPLTIMKMIYYIKKFKIDLVIVNIKKEIILAGFAAKICKIPVFRLIGNERDFINIRFLQEKLVDLNIFPCQKALDLAIQQFPWVKKLNNKVNYIGINPQEVSAEQIQEERKRLNLIDELIIGVTGRIVKKKGVDFLIQAYASIASQYPHTRLVINGSGKYKEEAIQLVKSFDLEHQIIFGGFAPNSTVSAATYDIAVLPSDYEAFPYAVVEYFSVGKPVIATNVGGIKELIQHEKNGLIVEARDIDQMTSALKRLLDHPDLRNRIAQEAMTTLKEKFTEDIMMDKFEQFYQEYTNCR